MRKLTVVPPARPGPVRAAVKGMRLDSWKEIASYLKRGVRTVQRWEREQGLPVHRLRHEKLGSVYAYASEVDAWWSARGSSIEDAGSKPSNARSIAVLPFTDLSREQDQSYLCDGVAETIINALSGVPDLRVCSRLASFRFRAGDCAVTEIARRLQVAALLQGSVRKAADRVRITVQLTNAADGFQLWSECYDRNASDIFAIQDEIADGVVHALEVTLTPGEKRALQRAGTSDLRAYDCYLRGREYYYQYSPRAIQFALQLFMHALEFDADYPQAYAGLADCWSYIYLYSDRSDEVRRQADWASLKALELDPASAQAQASRGLSLSLDGKHDDAEECFESAIHSGQELFEAFYFYARHAFAAGEFAKAAALYQEAMRLRPDDYQSPLLVAQIYDVLGRPADATASRRRGVQLAQAHARLHPDDARSYYMAANGMAVLGKRGLARQWAERALVLRPDDPMTLYNVGCVFCMLDSVDQAFDCLEKAARSGLTQKGWYEHDSNLDPLRKFPRFEELLRILD